MKTFSFLESKKKKTFKANGGKRRLPCGRRSITASCPRKNEKEKKGARRQQLRRMMKSFPDV
jgi:hypothetical protein